MSRQPVDRSRFVGQQLGELDGQCRKNEELDGQAGQRRDWVDRGIAAWVRARLYFEMAILNSIVSSGAYSGEGLTRRWCGRIGGDDTSVAQPHSALIGVGGPSEPEDQLARCYPKSRPVSTRLTTSVWNVLVGTDRRICWRWCSSAEHREIVRWTGSDPGHGNQ